MNNSQNSEIDLYLSVLLNSFAFSIKLNGTHLSTAITKSSHLRSLALSQSCGLVFFCYHYLCKGSARINARIEESNKKVVMELVFFLLLGCSSVSPQRSGQLPIVTGLVISYGNRSTFSWRPRSLVTHVHDQNAALLIFYDSCGPSFRNHSTPINQSLRKWYIQVLRGLCFEFPPLIRIPICTTIVWMLSAICISHKASQPIPHIVPVGIVITFAAAPPFFSHWFHWQFV